MRRKKIISNCSKGFTLVELIIAIGISGIVLAAIFSIYKLQQQHYTAQMDVTEMQQNIRAAFNLLSREIRMAGFDQEGSGAAEIIEAKPDLFYFTVDFNEDGDTDDTGEHIAYDLYIPDPPAPQVPKLGRRTSNATIAVNENPAGSGHWEAAGHLPAAENIEHLEFVYLDEDGNVTADVNKIYTVVITIVARAEKEDIRYKNTMTYTPASNLTAYVPAADLSGITWVKNDNLRRRLQTLCIQCRNMGI
ncbi:MAG: prepilin-type N-terminal cleavage/methylation domain-containing protein [Desulfobulbales bacterium]